ncbi:MAG: penicillin-binding protein 1C, partial [Chthoniobacterales bacterium]
PARREIAEFWPSDLLQLFAAAGLPRKLPPPFPPGEKVEALARTGRPPRITSPRSDVTYSPSTGSRVDRALTLAAETDSDVETVYWFAGREFLGATKRNTPLQFQPRPGQYAIVALDDHGRSDSRAIVCAD